MKLERLHEYIIPTIVIFIGVVLAVYCGTLSGNGQTSTLAAVMVGVVLLAAFLILRQNIWQLIPITIGLTGSILLLPLQFSPRDLTVACVFVGFVVLRASRVIRLKPKFEAVDAWMFVMLFYLATVYIRNPVGLDALGSDRVGGRPYFNTFISVVAYWVLTRALLHPRHVVLLILLICLGRMSEGILSFITTHFPETVPVLSQLYSGVDKAAYDAQDVRAVQMGEGTAREISLALIGNPVILALWSFFRPLTVINPLYIFRFTLLALAFWSVFASGFRSSFAASFAMMYIASYLRRGPGEIFRLTMLVAPAMLLMIMGQGTLFDLPRSAQRALSFLPGNWDPVAVEDAKGSTEWRVGMWKTMLTEDKYLHNKWLGDGFGFSQRDLAVLAANQISLDPDAQVENALIVGGVHSGPVSTIRFVGVVGLIIYVGLMVVIARTSWRTIRRSEGTSYYPLALFVGLPLIWGPVNYIFVFGGFDSSLPDTVFGVAMLKMLQNSLDALSPQPDSAPVARPTPLKRPVLERRPNLVGAKRIAGFRS